MGVLTDAANSLNLAKMQTVGNQTGGWLQPVSDKSKRIVDTALSNEFTSTLTPQPEAIPQPEYQYTNPSEAAANGMGAAGLLTVLNGATGIINSANQLGQIADTSWQQKQIDSMSNIGRNEYNSFDQIGNAWQQVDSIQPDLDFDTIRGGNKTERFGNLLSGIASGAVSGAQVGGVYGGILGGFTGLATGLGSWITGDTKADDELKRLKLERDTSRNVALQNLNARTENLADYKFRNRVANVSATGGQIERKNTTLKDFADSVTKRAKANDTTHSAGIVREYCNGGVKIRIKR